MSIKSWDNSRLDKLSKALNTEKQLPLKPGNNFKKPLMLGSCESCIHQETCRYEGYAKYLLERFSECSLDCNPFKLTCDNFDNGYRKVIE